jgi:hypothetical protein
VGQIRVSKSRVYSRAAEFLADIKKSEERDTVEAAEPRKRRRGREHVGVRPLKEFHAGPVYSGDLRRADMAWAKHAAGCGLTLEQIKDELVNGRSTAATSARRATQAAARIRHEDG